MKITCKAENLDCANCAAKMERAILKIKGVNQASVNFMTQRVELEIDESNREDIIAEVTRVCKKVEPDCELKFVLA